MEIKTLDHKGNFSIIDDNKELLTARYEEACHDELHTAINGINITIQPRDNWQRTFDITKDGSTCGEIVFKVNGDIIIATSNLVNNSSEWIVKKKGFTSFHFEVSDKSGEMFATIKPTSFDKKKFRFNYQVEFTDDSLVEKDIAELALYSVFGINLYKTKQDNMEI
jgi:hypothetical protein